MKVVIQCASRKHLNYYRAASSQRVCFVADPATAPRGDGLLYAHPDGRFRDGKTWREAIIEYNRQSENPLGLLRACDLYSHPIYQDLARTVGVENLFILSAGWGLIRADWFTPYYDITFSKQVLQKGEPFKYRDNKSNWPDLCHLPLDGREPLVLFGGLEYLNQFSALTRDYSGERIVFHAAANPARIPGCTYRFYPTAGKTNWHYTCAKDFIAGRLQLNGGPPVAETRSTVSPQSRSTTGSAEPPKIARRKLSGRANADDFRNALNQLLVDATRQGKLSVRVAAGELHREVGGYPGRNHAMPSCCAVMRSMMMDKDGIECEPPSGKGASLAIRYKLPRK